jgi:CxxC-x17-CxxC domain-containing protein
VTSDRSSIRHALRIGITKNADGLVIHSSRDSYSSGGYDDRESYGSSYGRNSYSNGGGNNSGYSSGTREMHSATCASCGREAKVPFVPRGDKPVYCSDCFQQQRQTSSRASTRW